jgi:hypothetical protein
MGKNYKGIIITIIIIVIIVTLLTIECQMNRDKTRMITSTTSSISKERAIRKYRELSITPTATPSHTPTPMKGDIVINNYGTVIINNYGEL